MTDRLKRKIKEQGFVLVDGNKVAAAKLNSGFILYRSDVNTVRVAHSSVAKTFVVASDEEKVCLDTVCTC